MPQKQKPLDSGHPEKPDDSAPSSPKVTKPDTKSLIEKMKKVNPDQARQYRQRTGQ